MGTCVPVDKSRAGPAPQNQLLLQIEGGLDLDLDHHRSTVTTADDEVARNVGLRIQAARLAANLTQSELAEATGIDRTYISRLERGRYNVSVSTLCRLARALGVSGGELLPDGPADPAFCEWW
jgi:ribosome-binding protein aMBF1 (putative translation factor)